MLTVRIQLKRWWYITSKSTFFFIYLNEFKWIYLKKILIFNNFNLKLFYRLLLMILSVMLVCGRFVWTIAFTSSSKSNKCDCSWSTRWNASNFKFLSCVRFFFRLVSSRWILLSLIDCILLDFSVTKWSWRSSKSFWVSSSNSFSTYKKMFKMFFLFF